MSEIKLCYLENHEQVVRKVRVPALSFTSVIEAAQGLLQDSPQAELVLQYCDHDDDKITIGTDLEFQTSIAEQKDTPKFFVKSKTKIRDVVDVDSEEVHSGILCSCCHEVIVGNRYKCVICPNYDLCKRCEFKGTHPGHDVLRIASSSKNYPPHFFTRLHRLFERILHPQMHLSTSSCGGQKSPGLEPMAKDLVDEDDDIMMDFVEVESNASAPYETPRPSSLSLPSIEELTKSVQDLTEKDLAQDHPNPDIKTETNLESETQKSNAAIEDVPPIVKECNAETIPENDAGDSKADNEIATNSGEDSKDNLQEESRDIKIELNVQDLVEDKSEQKIVIDFSKVEDEASKMSNLSKLQDEIDKLLAPLTPRNMTPQITTPTEANDGEETMQNSETCIDDNLNDTRDNAGLEEIAEVNEDEEPDEPAKINDEKIVDTNPENQIKLSISTSSSFSSSPFELCDVNGMNEVIVEQAVIENHETVKSPESEANPDPKGSPTKLPITINRKESSRTPRQNGSKGSEDEIEVIEAQDIVVPEEKSKPDPTTVTPHNSPVSEEEAAELLKIVEENERLEREAAGGDEAVASGGHSFMDVEVDRHLLASSRLMLQNQLSRNQPKSALRSLDRNPYRTSQNLVTAPPPHPHHRSMMQPPQPPASTNRNPFLNTRRSLYDNPYHDYRTSYNLTSPTSPPSRSVAMSPTFDDFEAVNTPAPRTTSSSLYESYRPSYYYGDSSSSSYSRSSTRMTSAASAASRNESGDVGQAVNQMMSMGFSDEDGWLTQLVRMKNGNIERVLDVLTPVKKQ